MSAFNPLAFLLAQERNFPTVKQTRWCERRSQITSLIRQNSLRDPLEDPPCSYCKFMVPITQGLAPLSVRVSIWVSKGNENHPKQLVSVTRHYSHFFALDWTDIGAVKSFSHAQNQRGKSRVFLTV